MSRKKLIGGTWDYIKENLDYPYYMIKDRLNAVGRKDLRSVKRGDGQDPHARRRARGRLPRSARKDHNLSPVCTHLGCIVHWN